MRAVSASRWVSGLAAAALLAASSAGAVGFQHLTAPGEPRFNLTCTLMGDGRVLVAGGLSTDGGTPLATTLLYDPLGNAWSAGPTMTAPRASHAALLLQDGRVLLVGGFTAGGAPLASTEMFDPSARAFAAGATMTAARARHTATRLNDGTVLVVGGGPSNSERYTTGQWTSAGLNLEARVDHTATLLPDGRVLVIGGTVAQAATASMEVFDPGAGSWSDGGQLSTPRTGHGATWDPATARVVVIGGGASAAEEVGGTVAPPGVLVHTAPLVDVMPDGRILIVGGGTAASQLCDDSALSVIDAGIAATTRDRACAVMLPTGRLLVIGGTDEATLSADLYDAFVDSWSATDGGMNLPHDRGALMLLPDGTPLVAGGAGLDLHAEIFDQTSSQWRLAAPMLAQHFSPTASMLDDGRVLFAGGTVGYPQPPTPITELYLSLTASWSDAGALAVPRSRHSAVALPEGRVLVIGGRPGDGTMGPDIVGTEVYDSDAGGWSPGPTSLFARTGSVTWLLKDGRVLVAGGYGLDVLGSEILDPGLQGWSDAGGFTTQHAEAFFALLPDGRPIMAGGCCVNNAVTEVYDLDAGTWSVAQPMPSARGAAQFGGALLRSGRWVVTASSSTAPQNTAFILDPVTLAWAVSGPMPAAYYWGFAQVLLDGRFLFGGTGLDPQTTGLLDELANHPWVPTLDPISLAGTGDVINITGSRFTGMGAGSSGSGRASPTNHPVLVLERVEGQARELARTLSFDSSSAQVRLPAVLPGAWRAWVVVSGVSSNAQSLRLVPGDGGFEGSDGGTAGDAGTLDAGAVDAGQLQGPRGYFVGCGCGSAPSPLLLAVVALARARRRRHASA